MSRSVAYLPPCRLATASFAFGARRRVWVRAMKARIAGAPDATTSDGSGDGLECIFSFGSNGTAQLQQRVRNGGPVFESKPARLKDHTRIFAGYSHRWGGAIASVYPCKGQHVDGLLMKVSREELQALDVFEGSYARSIKTVWTTEGDVPCEAWIYVKDNTSFTAPPSDTYMLAITKMLSEGGHDLGITINYLGEEGTIITSGLWNNSGLTELPVMRER